MCLITPKSCYELLTAEKILQYIKYYTYEDL